MRPVKCPYTLATFIFGILFYMGTSLPALAIAGPAAVTQCENKALTNIGSFSTGCAGRTSIEAFWCAYSDGVVNSCRDVLEGLEEEVLPKCDKGCHDAGTSQSDCERKKLAESGPYHFTKDSSSWQLCCKWSDDKSSCSDPAFQENNPYCWTVDWTVEITRTRHCLDIGQA